MFMHVSGVCMAMCVMYEYKTSFKSLSLVDLKLQTKVKKVLVM